MEKMNTAKIILKWKLTKLYLKATEEGSKRCDKKKINLEIFEKEFGTFFL